MTPSRLRPPSLCRSAVRFAVRLPARLRRFGRDAQGAVTVWMLFWCVAFMLLGGLAVDGANAWRMRAALQSVADASAHAAAMRLSADGEAAARGAAIAYARDMLPREVYGDVLVPGDVEIGAWDAASRRLSAGGAEPDAVRVTLRRAEVNANPEPTYFLRLTGFMGWDVSASSTAKIASSGGGGEDACWRQGLVARGMIDISSNNVFRRICLHGEQGVNIQNQNDWREEVEVSMPDLDLLELPSSDIDSHNPGLADALLTARNDPWVVDYVDEIIYAIRDENPAVWIDNALFDPADAEPGVVYWVYCVGDGGLLDVRQNTVLEDVVILTNCAIRFKKSVMLINTLMGTTGDRIEEGAEEVEAVDGATTVVVDDGSTSVAGANELRLGKADDCAPGGGARLLIDGDFRNPAKLRVHGSQIIATGDVELAAQGEAVEGISILAGGNIELTSNTVFGACAEQDFETPGVAAAVALVE